MLRLKAVHQLSVCGERLKLSAPPPKSEKARAHAALEQSLSSLAQDAEIKFSVIATQLSTLAQSLKPDAININSSNTLAIPTAASLVNAMASWLELFARLNAWFMVRGMFSACFLMII